jgi:hypothetical protein
MNMDSKVLDDSSGWSIDQRGIPLDAEGNDDVELVPPDQVPPCPFQDHGKPVPAYPVAACDEIRKILNQGPSGMHRIMQLLDGQPSKQTMEDIVIPIYIGGGYGGVEGQLAYRNETILRWYYRLMKLEHNLCYAAPQFKMTVPSPAYATTGKTFNTFDWCGTNDLAHDMETFRNAIGVRHMSMRGSSYGTAVVATYATIYPQKVDKVVMDGVVTPDPDVKAKATSAAFGQEAVWTAQTKACDDSLLQGFPDNETCPLAPDSDLKAWDMLLGNDPKKAM